MAAPSRPNALAMLPVTPTEAAASAMMVMVVSFFFVVGFPSCARFGTLPTGEGF